MLGLCASGAHETLGCREAVVYTPGFKEPQSPPGNHPHILGARAVRAIIPMSLYTSGTLLPRVNILLWLGRTGFEGPFKVGLSGLIVQGAHFKK